MVGRMNFPFWPPAYFQGRSVSSRECTWKRIQNLQMNSQILLSWMPLMQQCWFGNDRTELPDFNQRCQMQGLEPCCTSKLVGRYDFCLLYKNHPIKSPFSHHWIFSTKIWWWKSVQDVHPNLITYNGFMDVCQKTGEWRVALQLLEDGGPPPNVGNAAVFFSKHRKHETIIKGHVESNHSKCWGIWITPLIYNKTASSEHLDLPGFYSWLHHLQFYHRCMSSLGWVDDSFIPSGWDASAEVSELA